MLNLDISQVIIQIIGFLVMLWVLKRYGWKPLLNTLEERRKKIQAEFDDIAVQHQKVKELTHQYEEKLKEIDAMSRKKIQEAVLDGNKIGAEIREQAQAQAREILLKVKTDMEGEIGKAKDQLKKDMVNIVIKTTEKILHERLDPSTHNKLINDFIEEMQVK